MCVLLPNWAIDDFTFFHIANAKFKAKFKILYIYQNHIHSYLVQLCSGLEKVLVSPWLVTVRLSHICGVIPSPETMCRYHHTEPSGKHRYRRIEWRVLHNVSQCFQSVSWCFTSVLWCFTMLSETCNDQHRRPPQPGIAMPQGSAITQQGCRIGDSSTEIGDEFTGIIDIAKKVIPC